MKNLYVHDKELAGYVTNAAEYGLEITDDHILANVIMVGFRHLVDNAFIRNFPNIECIICPATGVDHIRTNNIPVIKLDPKKCSLITASSEYTLLLIMSVLRRAPQLFRGEIVVGSDINSLSIGFVGYGRIGNNVAKYVRAMGASVSWYDTNAASNDQSGFKMMDDVLADSDVVVVAVSATSDNERLMGDREFSMMKRGSFFVNISRGFVVDDHALLRALESEKLSGAALDVVNDSSVYEGYLERNSNLIITNHVAGTTHRSRSLACDAVLKEYNSIYGARL